jgi:hypothetical protein
VGPRRDPRAPQTPNALPCREHGKFILKCPAVQSAWYGNPGQGSVIDGTVGRVKGRSESRVGQRRVGIADRALWVTSYSKAKGRAFPTESSILKTKPPASQRSDGDAFVSVSGRLSSVARWLAHSAMNPLQCKGRPDT